MGPAGGAGESKLFFRAGEILDPTGEALVPFALDLIVFG